jgi:hypothetical protein
MGGGIPRKDDVWEVEFATYYGDVFKRRIGEDKVPKYIKDRRFDGEFGSWLKGHFKTSEKTKILELSKVI